MKPLFVKCSCESTEYKGREIKNHPVNINLIVQVKKGKESWYPDNEGTPSIKFKSTVRDIVWVYASYQKRNRDEDYERIINSSS
mgnify:CR=1 FL=1